MGETRAYWLDYDHDADNASDGGSRYGGYLSRQADLFDALDEDDDLSLAFAALAWEIGTSPVMSPPFIRSHPLILGTKVRRSDANSEIVAEVDLAVPPPDVVASVRRYGGWSIDSFGRVDTGGDEALVRGPVVLTRSMVLTQLRHDAIPTVTKVPADGPDRQRLAQAVASVAALALALSAEIGPLIERLT